MSTTKVPGPDPSTASGVALLRLAANRYVMSLPARKVQTKPRLFGFCIFNDVSSACTTSAAATKVSSLCASGSIDRAA